MGCILVVPFCSRCDVGGRAGSRYTLGIHNCAHCISSLQRRHFWQSLASVIPQVCRHPDSCVRDITDFVISSANVSALLPSSRFNRHSSRIFRRQAYGSSFRKLPSRRAFQVVTLSQFVTRCKAYNGLAGATVRKLHDGLNS
jgi:hypothetical protein